MKASTYIRGIYPLLSDDVLSPRHFVAAAQVLAPAVSVLQLRLKTLPDGATLAVMRDVARALRGWDGLIIINDRADFARILRDEEAKVTNGARLGLHIGQGDLPVSAARAVVGPDVPIGLSTHTLAELTAAPVDKICYLALGPVFPTTTKRDAEPVVGLETLAAAVQQLPTLPVVAIGGISEERLPAVRATGAAAAALISALVPPHAADPIGELTRRVTRTVAAWKRGEPRDG